MRTSDHRRVWRAGFTLVEAMLALALIGIAFAMTLTALVHTMKNTESGSSQIQFIQESRLVEQKIAALVQEGKAVSVNSNYVSIMSKDLTMSKIYFWDEDDDLGTVTNNYLLYLADMDSTDDPEIICNHVSEIKDEPMFSLLPLSPDAAKFCFHLGDGTNVNENKTTGPGFQGVEVRFSATPRNRQFFYD